MTSGTQGWKGHPRFFCYKKVPRRHTYPNLSLDRAEGARTASPTTSVSIMVVITDYELWYNGNPSRVVEPTAGGSLKKGGYRSNEASDTL